MAPTRTTRPSVTFVVVVLMALVAAVVFGWNPLPGSGQGAFPKKGEEIDLSSVAGLRDDSQLFSHQKSLGMIVFYDTNPDRPRNLHMTLSYLGTTDRIETRTGISFDLSPTLHGWYNVVPYSGSRIRFHIADSVHYPFDKDHDPHLICGMWLNDDLKYVEYQAGTERVTCSYPPR